MLTANQVLQKGRYRIINSFANDEKVGLYDAYDTVSNTNVVLRESVGRLGKVATASQLEAANAAFMGEAKALTGIKHDALLSVQDYFSEVDRQYLVMESADGHDLAKMLNLEEKRPALSDVLAWADQLLDALNYLHNLPQPFIHRDIRPENIKLTSGFKVKLLTAGISSAFDSDVIAPEAANQSDGSILHYRPLEQLWGGLDPSSQKVITNRYGEESERLLLQPLDGRSDQYSLAATIYHILTLTPPTDALERTIETLDGNIDPLIPPAELEPSIPLAVSEALMKALSIRREGRFDSAMDMRHALQTSYEGSKAKPVATTSAPQVDADAAQLMAEKDDFYRKRI
jgi:serine/threonine protein kinase